MCLYSQILSWTRIFLVLSCCLFQIYSAAGLIRCQLCISFVSIVVLLSLSCSRLIAYKHGHSQCDHLPTINIFIRSHTACSDMTERVYWQGKGETHEMGQSTIDVESMKGWLLNHGGALGSFAGAAAAAAASCSFLFLHFSISVSVATMPCRARSKAAARRISPSVTLCRLSNARRASSAYVTRPKTVTERTTEMSFEKVLGTQPRTLRT